MAAKMVDGMVVTSAPWMAAQMVELTVSGMAVTMDQWKAELRVGKMAG